MATLAEILAKAQKEKIQKESIFTKVLNTVRTGEFAVGGLLSGVGARKGIQQRISPSKALGIKSGIGGFVTDVLLDPLTYTGIGALTKAGKAAQLGIKGAKLLPHIGQQVAAGQRAFITFAGRPLIRGEKVLGGLGKVGTFLREDAPVISNVIQKLGKTFSPSFRPKGVTPEAFEIFRKAQLGARGLERGLSEAGIKTASEIGREFKKLGIQESEQKNILQSLERGLPVEEEFKDVFSKAQKVFDEGTKQRQRLGKAVLQQSDLEYVPHLIKKGEAEDVSKAAEKYLSGSRLFTTKSPSDIQRTIEGSIVEINKRAGRPIFSEDLPTLVGMAGKRQGRLEAGHFFLDGVREAGQPIKQAPTGWIKSTAPELKGMAFHPELARHIDATYKSFSEIDDVNDFIKMYDKVQNGWKGLATFVNPAFHSRNAISNIWQNYLAGVSPISKAYLRSADILRKGAKVTGKDAELLKAFKDAGLSRMGAFGADIERAIAEQISPTAFQRVLKPFGIVGNTIEDHAKFAHFIDKVNKGASFEGAAASVRKYLFDYTDLTDFEKNVMKRIIPFYTWTRKNLPLQLGTLVQDPSKFAQLGKGIDAIERATGGDTVTINEELIPEFIRKGVPIQLGRGADNMLSFFRLQNFIPSADIENLTDLKDIFVNPISPLLKTPFELMMNRNIFFDEPIISFPGEQKLLLGQPVPSVVEYLAGQIRPLTEIEKIFDKTRTGKERFLNLAAGGKIYKYDIQKLKKGAEFRRNLEVGRINAAITKMKREGKIDEVRRLEKMKRELQLKKF